MKIKIPTAASSGVFLMFVLKRWGITPNKQIKLLILILSLLFILACTPEQSKDVPVDPSGVPETGQVQQPLTNDQNWCKPVKEESILGTYEAFGLIEEYEIEGKRYDVCHDRRINEQGILVSERWYTQGFTVSKETLLDTDDVYGTVTTWTENGRTCTHIVKERGGIDELIC